MTYSKRYWKPCSIVKRCFAISQQYHACAEDNSRNSSWIFRIRWIVSPIALKNGSTESKSQTLRGPVFEKNILLKEPYSVILLAKLEGLTPVENFDALLVDLVARSQKAK